MSQKLPISTASGLSDIKIVRISAVHIPFLKIPTMKYKIAESTDYSLQSLIKNSAMMPDFHKKRLF